MPDVTVIQPTEAVEAAIEHHELSIDSETVRVLGFPKLVAEFDIELERKVLTNRETTMSVTVDRLTGTCGINDIFPDLQSRTLSSTSLLNPRVEAETATDNAYSVVRRQVNRKYKSFTAPEIHRTRTDTVFKLFWVVPTSSRETVTVIDTITNEQIADEVKLTALPETLSPPP